MTARPVGFLCLWIGCTSAAATAQQPTDSTKSSPTTATKVTNLTYPAAGFIPWRRVERTTASGGRKVVIETVEAPGLEGTWIPFEEVVTDTTTRQTDVFRFDFARRPRLAETTQSELETQPNARTRNVERTWVADLDGRLTLSSGYVEETSSLSSGVQQRNATVSLRSTDGTLREVERNESTEQHVGPAVVRRESTNSVRDLNGRWLPTESRSGQTHGIGSAERVEEEAIQRQNLSGALVLSDKVIARTSESNGDNRAVIETYSQDAEGFVRSDSHLALQQRVRRSTTETADGGRSTVEEIETRNSLAPNDPMRVTRRTVVTVRSVAPGRWITERQMFERDPNGRMVLVTDDTDETTEK